MKKRFLIGVILILIIFITFITIRESVDKHMKNESKYLVENNKFIK